jgi:hypothetical protein
MERQAWRQTFQEEILSCVLYLWTFLARRWGFMITWSMLERYGCGKYARSLDATDSECEDLTKTLLVVEEA